jgi:hypothetical protein
MHTKVWSENLKGRDHSEDLDIDRRIVFEWILGKLRCEQDSSGPRQEPVAGYWEHGNEPSRSIKVVNSLIS